MSRAHETRVRLLAWTDPNPMAGLVDYSCSSSSDEDAGGGGEVGSDSTSMAECIAK